ncbi:alpha/beta fold hydrolase [Idiomarina seosinensis]|uniref:Homoserine acetyltransferase n=1 Tax=Idiomarina seosinensis TaxID=281739 RepID=A0A432ZD06_9GAMM|nr:alpha/beta fold hydrolase [Idiomarina seosinensis]RUO75779.1 homoserine acetyltransferase [Idiomarina seosinensis]
MVLPVGRSFYVTTDYGRVKGFRYAADNGRPDAPVVVVQGGISGTGQLWRLDGSGWWQSLYDAFAETEDLQVISFDYLGGLGGSTTPEQPLTVEQHALAYLQALEKLGVDRIHGWVGGSFGGVLGLQAASLKQGPPIDRLTVIGAAHKPSIQSSLLRSFQQLLLQNCDCEQQGVVLARALAMLSYRNADEFERRFEHPDDALEYLLAQGERLLQRHGKQANKLFTHLTPILNDYHIDVRQITCPVQLVSFSSDTIAPPALVSELEALLPDCDSYVSIETPFGHDGFIKNVADYQTSLSQYLPQLAETHV